MQSLAECQIKKQIVLIFRLSLWLILAAKSIAYIMEALCGAIKEGLDERKLEKEKETPEQTEEKPAGKKLRARKGAKAAEEAQAE